MQFILSVILILGVLCLGAGWLLPNIPASLAGIGFFALGQFIQQIVHHEELCKLLKAQRQPPADKSP